MIANLFMCFKSTGAMRLNFDHYSFTKILTDHRKQK